MGAVTQRFPRWWQALIIIAGGIVLGLSSCVGFLGTLNFNGRGDAGQVLPLLLAAGFFGGIIIAFVGVILLLIAIARAVVNSFAQPAIDPAISMSAPTGNISVAAGPSALSASAYPESQALRQFQITLVVMMLLPAGSVATTVLVFINRYRAAPSIALIVISYVLSQGPYALAFARTRRGPDRLGIAIAFAASCVFFVEGLLSLSRAPEMFRYGPAAGIFVWPGLFLIGHIVVAVFAWRAGRLAPPEEGDLGLIVTSFAGVILYLVVVRFLEVHFLPLLLR
ncbi:MAG TPA: hypothetical protein VMB02_07820 [Candidatus Aquilonibacter sp.]|nr:hypothetical protein [Candidatus Aquilonibacter sp.]